MNLNLSSKEVNVRALFIKYKLFKARTLIINLLMHLS